MNGLTGVFPARANPCTTAKFHFFSFFSTFGLPSLMVYATETGFGLTKFSSVLEPTTGTLGLLALAVLAARRRRK